MQRDDRAGVIKADLHGMSALSSVVAVEFALSFAPRALHHKLVVVTGKVAPSFFFFFSQAWKVDFSGGRGGYRVLRSGEYTSRNVLVCHWLWLCTEAEHGGMCCFVTGLAVY